jgi:hypothetical protein
MINPAQYKQYFSNLASSHTLLKDFAYGLDERVINRERSNVAFPLLWAEDPTINPIWKQGLTLQFRGRLLVLENTPVDDWEKQEQAQDRTWQIAMDILIKMIEDSETGVFDLSLSSLSIDPVFTYLNDNDIGFEIAFQLESASAYCVNESVWQ